MRKVHISFVFIVLLLSVSLIPFLFDRLYCQTRIVAKNSGGTSPVIDAGNIFKSYTLITTITPPGKNMQKGGKVYLIDLFGNPVHTWVLFQTPFYAKLSPNGNLYVSLASYNPKSIYPANALTPVIVELDWNGKVIQEFKNAAAHHDFDILPNGNVVTLVWDKLPDDSLPNIKGGIVGSELNGHIFGDTIVETDKNGQTVWEWSTKDHLDPLDYPLDPLVPREEWGYANSIQYVAKDPFSDDEAYLLSLRTLNTVLLISKKTGNIIWRSPVALLNHQHDATVLKNGHVLVFDNGFYIRMPLIHNGSRILEIDPTTNTIVWEFTGGENPLEKFAFWSSLLSGAQRLPNGNTLIVKGLTGELMEVTPNKKVVWDMINPFGIQTSGPFVSRSIFKARRYSAEDIQFPEKLEAPMPEWTSYCKT